MIKVVFSVSQDSVATCVRCGGMHEYVLWQLSESNGKRTVNVRQSYARM